MRAGHPPCRDAPWRVRQAALHRNPNALGRDNLLRLSASVPPKPRRGNIMQEGVKTPSMGIALHLSPERATEVMPPLDFVGFGALEVGRFSMRGLTPPPVIFQSFGLHWWYHCGWSLNALHSAAWRTRHGASLHGMPPLPTSYHFPWRTRHGASLHGVVEIHPQMFRRCPVGFRPMPCGFRGEDLQMFGLNPVPHPIHPFGRMRHGAYMLG